MTTPILATNSSDPEDDEKQLYLLRLILYQALSQSHYKFSGIFSIKKKKKKKRLYFVTVLV